MKENLFDILRGENLRNKIDVDEFWCQVFQLPTGPNMKYSRAKVLCLRYYKNGSIKLTYKEIAKELEINSPVRVKVIHDQALRMMRHPYRTRQYAPLPELPISKIDIPPLRLGLY